MTAIKSVVETSMVDWDGKIVMVLFAGGCNFRCPFCQNWEVAFKSNDYDDVPWAEVVRKLEKRRDWIDGVVISGGEPLLDKEFIFELGKNIKDLNFKVKIDTNGGNPELLEAVIKKGLADYVALDIKAPLDERYSISAGKKIDLYKIKRSIELLKSGKVDYEFRTTAVPTLVSREATAKIGEVIEGGKRFILQQFVPRLAFDPDFQILKPYTKDEAQELLTILKKYVAEVKLRGF